MKSCVIDIETDGLNNPSMIHVMVAKDVESGKVDVFYPHNHPTQQGNWDEAKKYIDGYDRIIGHNFIYFDHRVLTSPLGGIDIPRNKVFDTLVLSQLLDAKREGGHSLEAWGERLGYAKKEHTDWTTYSDAMLERCITDTHLNHKVYEYLMKIVDRNKGKFDKAIDIEMWYRFMCRDMHDNGFKFDIDAAKSMHAELEVKLSNLLGTLRNAFPPRAKLVRVVTPKVTRNGTISKQGISNWYTGNDYTIFSEGASFSLVEWEPFSPTSPKQVVDRLWEAGWSPVEKTDGHLEALKSRDHVKVEHFKKYGWKINEANLATLPEGAPEACGLLVEYILTDARRRTLEEWMAAFRPDSGRIHGDFNPLGTRTHRCAHSKPNMGNIATKKTIKYNTPHLRSLATDYGGRMRQMWICEKDSWLVGCDMESAHLRIFAHLINDKEFTKSLLEGKKEDGTDPHSVNKRVLGEVCADRDRAKTFIFSLLNGAKSPKVAAIFGCSRQDASTALNTFEKRYNGLTFLNKDVIPRDAARGYFEGVDGRLVISPEEHGMIGMYLQNMESVLMKYANRMWIEELDSGRYPKILYRQVNWVHDEWVTEVFGSEDDARLVGRVQSDSIRRVGELFGLRCPMGGEYKIGKNWLEVH